MSQEDCQLCREDLEDLLQMHHRNLVRELDSNIQKHLDHMHNMLTALTSTLVENERSSDQTWELDESEMSSMLPMPVQSTPVQPVSVVHYRDHAADGALPEIRPLLTEHTDLEEVKSNASVHEVESTSVDEVLLHSSVDKGGSHAPVEILNAHASLDTVNLHTSGDKAKAHASFAPVKSLDTINTESYSNDFSPFERERSAVVAESATRREGPRFRGTKSPSVHYMKSDESRMTTDGSKTSTMGCRIEASGSVAFPRHRHTQISNAVESKERLDYNEKMDDMVYSKRCKFIHSVTIGPAILINSIFVGFRVAYLNTGKEHDSMTHTVLDVGSLFFCIAFTGELLCKLFLSKKRFFMGNVRIWHLLDSIIVVLMVIDEAIRRSNAEIGNKLSITWISALRLGHFMKIKSRHHPMPFFPELQMASFTIQKCFRGTLVHIVIGFSCVYLCALAFTEASANHCVAENSNSSVCEHFGSLSSSMFSLFATLVGGLPLTTLYNEIRSLGLFFTLLFVLFVTCAPLVLLNSLLAAVIDTHNQCVNIAHNEYAIKQEKEKRNNYMGKLTEIFHMIDDKRSGTISKEQMTHALQDQQMVGLLDTMKLQIDDVDAFFELLDADRSDSLELEEFIFGCLRINGYAKGTDLLRVLCQVDSLRKMLDKIFHRLDHVSKLSSGISALSAAVEDQTQIGAALNLSNSVPKIKSNRAIRASGSDVAVTWSKEDIQRRKGALVKHWGSNRSWSSSGSNCTWAPLLRSVALRRSVQPNMALRADMKIWKKGKGKRIPKVEERAMLLEEMRDISQTVNLLCASELWQDEFSLKHLQPEDVNLHHFNDYVILPETLPNGAILRVCPHVLCVVGDGVKQYEEDGTLLACGLVQQVLPAGQLKIKVTWGRFSTQLPHSLVIDGDDSGKLVEILADHLSYKELISPASLKADWFCSHWWGESIVDFVSCVESHSELHQFSKQRTGYWVCAYANDQHNLGTELGNDVENSSFRKAMKLSSGTLLILDSKATAFSRIWCDLEIYKTVIEGKEFDVVTASKQLRRPRLITQRAGPGETSHAKMKRELRFPLHILERGICVKLEQGNATQETDKEEILKSMAADFACEGQDFQKCLELACSKANTTLSAYFALAAWPLAVSKHLVTDFDRSRPGSLNLQSILRRDQWRKRLALSFSHIMEMSDAEVSTLASGLPSGLEELELHFKSCTHITDQGLSVLLVSVSHLLSMQKLNLDFNSCKHITDRSLINLANSFPEAMKELRLDLACTSITEAGVLAFGHSLPDTLEVFSATFKGCKGTRLNRDFHAVHDIRGLALQSQSDRSLDKWQQSLKSRSVSVGLRGLLNRNSAQDAS